MNSKAGVGHILVLVDKIEVQLVHFTISYPGTFEEDVGLCVKQDEYGSLVGTGEPWIKVVYAGGLATAVVDIVHSSGSGSRATLVTGDSIEIKLTYGARG